MSNGTSENESQRKTKLTPEQVATSFALYVWTLIRVVLWALAAAVVLTFGFVAVRLLIWGVQQVFDAAGI